MDGIDVRAASAARRSPLCGAEACCRSWTHHPATRPGDARTTKIRTDPTAAPIALALGAAPAAHAGTSRRRGHRSATRRHRRERSSAVAARPARPGRVARRDQVVAVSPISQTFDAGSRRRRRRVIVSAASARHWTVTHWTSRAPAARPRAPPTCSNRPLASMLSAPRPSTSLLVVQSTVPPSLPVNWCGLDLATAEAAGCPAPRVPLGPRGRARRGAGCAGCRAPCGPRQADSVAGRNRPGQLLLAAPGET